MYSFIINLLLDFTLTNIGINFKRMYAVAEPHGRFSFRRPLYRRHDKTGGRIALLFLLKKAEKCRKALFKIIR